METDGLVSRSGYRGCFPTYLGWWLRLTSTTPLLLFPSWLCTHFYRCVFFLAWNHQPWFQLVFCVSQAQIVVGKSKEQQHQRAGVAIPQSHRILQPKCIQRFRMVHWNPQSYCRTAGIGSLGKLIFIGLAKGDIKTGTLELLFPHFSMGETPHALLQIFHDVSFKN